MDYPIFKGIYSYKILTCVNLKSVRAPLVGPKAQYIMSLCCNNTTYIHNYSFASSQHIIIDAYCDIANNLL